MKLSKILFEAYSRWQLLDIDPMKLSKDEYVDEYLQGLFAEFSHGMSELENYVPLDRVRVQYVTIPKENKEDIKFWLKSKVEIEGPASNLDMIKKIGEDKKILEPVILDTRNEFTVEGRHRLSAALKYGLDVPALLIMDEPFEEVKGIDIVSLRGCENHSFEVDLDNGEVKDCTDISDELARMFNASGVRIMSNENPYSALIDGKGKVYGGLVVSFELPDDYDEFEHGSGVITFSVVVDPAVRGQRFAEKLINDLINSNRRSLIKAQVINPAMEKILIGLGFEKTSETGSREGLVYELNRKSPT